MTHWTQTQRTQRDDATRKGPTADGRELESKHPAQQKRDDGSDIPLPYESDQSIGSQDEEGTREVGEQAHEDLERGLQDTDRRGGGEYQERTQSDAHVNRNSKRKK
jgi:hypothetical protein